MCGRYNLKNAEALAALVASLTTERPILKPRYNIAPSQINPVVKNGDSGRPDCVEMRWGFVPFWDQAEKPKFAPANARSEEMLGKPTFRQSVQQRRCAVPADGFYEWKRLNEKTRMPYHFALKGGGPFFIAGLYEAATATRPETYCLLTTGPNELMAPIHDRMPVILNVNTIQSWLEPGPMTPEKARSICQPYAAEQMEAWAVSPIVNSPKHDGPDCVAPLSEPETLF
jgi:putative SOS response-associated peptidase YedK